MKHMVFSKFYQIIIKAPNNTKVRSEGYTSYPYDIAYRKFGFTPMEESEVLVIAYLILQQFKLDIFEKGYFPHN